MKKGDKVRLTATGVEYFAEVWGFTKFTTATTGTVTDIERDEFYHQPFLVPLDVEANATNGADEGWWLAEECIEPLPTEASDAETA